jgi:hypothetical protein
MRDVASAERTAMRGMVALLCATQRRFCGTLSGFLTVLSQSMIRRALHG